MPVFKQQIKVGVDYTLNVTSNGAAAVTLIQIRRDRIAEVDALTTPVLRTAQLPSSTQRVLMFVNVPAGGGAEVVVKHDGTETIESVSQDTLFALEAVG